MEATLITEITTKDSGGLPYKENAKETVIFAEEKSAVRSEFYEAMRAGLSVKTTFEARQEDFELSAQETDAGKVYATKLEYDGTVYDIIRTYKKGKSKIEIVCG